MTEQIIKVPNYLNDDTNIKLIVECAYIPKRGLYSEYIEVVYSKNEMTDVCQNFNLISWNWRFESLNVQNDFTELKFIQK